MAGGTRKRQAPRLSNSSQLGRQVNINLMVDETGLDEPKVDETAVDKTAVNEPGPTSDDLY